MGNTSATSLPAAGSSSDPTKVLKAGDTMTGTLVAPTLVGTGVVVAGTATADTATFVTNVSNTANAGQGYYFQHANVDKWALYQPGMNAASLYIRDIANSKQHVIFTPGAAAGAGDTVLNSAASIVGNATIQNLTGAVRALVIGNETTSTGNGTDVELWTPANEPLYVYWRRGGVSLWLDYMLGNSNVRYLRDVANAKMHVTYIPGAGIGGGRTDFSTVVRVLQEKKHQPEYAPYTGNSGADAQYNNPALVLSINAQNGSTADPFPVTLQFAGYASSPRAEIRAYDRSANNALTTFAIATSNADGSFADRLTIGTTGAVAIVAGLTAASFDAGSGTIATTGVINGGSLALSNPGTGIIFGADTNLYRSAADQLKTDDSLWVVGTLTASAASITGSAGLYVNNGLTVVGGATVGSLAAGSGTISTTGAVNGGTGTFTGLLTAASLLANGTGIADGSDLLRVRTSAGTGYLAVTQASSSTVNVDIAQGNVVLARFTSAGNLGLGTGTAANRLTLATHTAAAGGIGFGTDVSLYRSAASTLTTAAAFNAGAITGTSVSAGSGTISTTGSVNGGTVTSTGAVNGASAAITGAVTAGSVNTGSGSIQTTGQMVAGGVSVTNAVAATTVQAVSYVSAADMLVAGNSLPRGYVASNTRQTDVSTSGSTPVTIVSTTFTAVAGRRYKFLFETVYLAPNTNTARFRIYAVAGSTATTTGATLVGARTPTGVGTAIPISLTGQSNALPSGTVTVFSTIDNQSGGHEVVAYGNASSQQFLLVEDIGT